MTAPKSVNEFATEPYGPIRDCIRSVIDIVPSPNTLTRWVTTGIRVSDGTVVLESVHIGGRLFTSIGAVRRFIARQQRGIAGPALVYQSAEDRKSAAEVAGGEQLRLMGC